MSDVRATDALIAIDVPSKRALRVCVCAQWHCARPRMRAHRVHGAFPAQGTGLASGFLCSRRSTLVNRHCARSVLGLDLHELWLPGKVLLRDQGSHNKATDFLARK